MKKQKGFLFECKGIKDSGVINLLPHIKWNQQFMIFYLHLNEFHISRMTNFVHLVFAFCLGAVAPALSYPETAFARPAQPCLAPLQWEGRSVEYNYDTGRNTRASVSYDAQNHRIRLLQQNKKHTPCQK